MENKNIANNLFLLQRNESNALGYNTNFLAHSYDVNFDILGKAYEGTGRAYAKLSLAIESNSCTSPNCEYERRQLKILKEAPALSIEFMSDLFSQLEITESPNFDPNNNFKYTVANSIVTEKPGFAKNYGYDVRLNLIDDGSQEMVFTGPLLEEPLIINSVALQALQQTGTSIVSDTPDINKLMLALMPQVGLFEPENVVDGELSPNAEIAEEFMLRNIDGTFDYEIIDIGNGLGRNVLQFDMDRIERKAMPFLNAEVAGILSSEQNAVALWNVYLAQGTSVEEDDQMVQNANAASKSWSYEKDLPLNQSKKKKFEKSFIDYFMNNYIKQFITNRLPTVTEDGAVFDLSEAKKAKAQKFIEDNNL
tara:strand:- start:1643 stop:2737 length:1095 start_codon:yes stop_codon:yes gene_type:complete